MNQRQEFLHYFFDSIKEHRYAILKNIYDDIYQLPESADIDLVIDENGLKEILQIISSGKHVARIKKDKKSFACFISIFFTDETYLEIDLIHRFDRKGIVYMDVEDVLHKCILNSQGLKTAAVQHQFEYVLLFYLLNCSKIPQRYVSYFSSMEKSQQNVLTSYMACKYVVHINNLEELSDFHQDQKLKILENIQHQPENQLLKMLAAGNVPDNVKGNFNLAAEPFIKYRAIIKKSTL